MKLRSRYFIIILLITAPVTQYLTNAEETSTINLSVAAVTADTFITKWNTSIVDLNNPTPDNQITLPIDTNNGLYDFTVDWGDGSALESITSSSLAQSTHTFSAPGVYEVRINGFFDGISTNGNPNKLKLIELSQWGNISLGNSQIFFSGAENMVLTATDSPDLSKTTSLKNLFYYCKSLGSTGDMSNWDVSNITNMINMFAYAETFNQPIGNWNVSSVESFWGTFVQAQSFDQDISNWDVSSVTIMQGMFSGATSFNQPLGNWDVSNVTNMDSMFYYATSFNQPLANWDVSNVTKMNKMFWTATSFNQPLGNWDVSNVTDMSYMFSSVTLTVSNYNNLLEGWSQLSLQNDVVFDGGISQYTSSIERQYIIDNFNWIITDGGLYEEPSSEASSSSSNISNSDDVPIEGDNVFVNYSPFLFISLILIGSVIIRRKK